MLFGQRRAGHTELARLLLFFTQKEKPMPAKLKTRHAAVAAALIAGSLAIPSGRELRADGQHADGQGCPERRRQKSAAGTGTVIALNAAGKKITFDHAPMPEIDWPAMKMEFPVAPSVDLSKVKTGDKVRFTLTGSGKNYTVQSISPQ